MPFGRMLIVLGVILVMLGVLVVVGERLPFKLGRLPGDINIEGKGRSFHFPIVTCLLLSVLLTVAVWIWNRLSR